MKVKGVMVQNPSTKTDLKGRFMRNMLIFACFAVSMIFANCDKTKEEDIIGKWNLIAQGYYDSYNNNSIVINTVENDWRPYIDFFPNGKMKRTDFFYEEHIETVYEYPFRIDEQFLYENYTDEINAFIYKYKIEKDKLTLEYVQGNILDISNPIVIYIYQRTNK